MSRKWIQCLLWFWVNAFYELQCHALGPKCLKRYDLRVTNTFALLEFGTLPMAEFWCHGCCKASAAKTAKREHGMEWPVPFQKAGLRGYWWWTKLSNTCARALCLPPSPKKQCWNLAGAPVTTFPSELESNFLSYRFGLSHAIVLKNLSTRSVDGPN